MWENCRFILSLSIVFMKYAGFFSLIVCGVKNNEAAGDEMQSLLFVIWTLWLQAMQLKTGHIKPKEFFSVYSTNQPNLWIISQI